MTYSKNSATNALTTAMITVMLLMGSGPFARPFTTASHKNSNLPSVQTTALGKKKPSVNTTTKSNPTPTPNTPAPGTPTPAAAPAPAPAPAVTTAAVKTVAKAPAKAAPAPVPAPAPVSTGYPWHTVKATMFWAGEGADESNGFIQNFSSAWQENWYTFFGGVDDPNSRCGWNPCAFTPLENPFYFALPFGDYTTSGPKSNLSVVPWYTGSMPSGTSILKNRWIEITANGKIAYAQWQDVGPYNENDVNYVFGTAAPAYTVGLDLSPAADNYLGNNGYGTVSWRFVEASQVPAGPWKTTVTTSGPAW